MLFKELAALFYVSENTLRKWIKSSKNEDVRVFGAKRGTGTFFYSEKEVEILLKEFKKLNYSS